MKYEIEIPEGWEPAEGEQPEHYGVHGKTYFGIPIRRKDTREDWQRAIDKGEFNHLCASGTGALLIPPGWTAREYKGWKYYTKPSLPDWVVSTPHREGWYWLHQDGDGQCYETEQRPSLLSQLEFMKQFAPNGPWKNLLVRRNAPANFRNERYRWEGQWVHRPWGSMPGEE